MKRANRVLSEREKDILELREAKVPYKTIAEKYGVSAGRIRQVFNEAKRKVREEQRRILTKEANQMPVDIKLKRADIFIICDALSALRDARSATITHTVENRCDMFDNDPVYTSAKQLENRFRELLNETYSDVEAYVTGGMEEAQES